MDRGARQAIVHGATRVRYDLGMEQWQHAIECSWAVRSAGASVTRSYTGASQSRHVQ